MSLAFDENGRPFIILREQEKKKRTKGLEAHKVSYMSKKLDCFKNNDSGNNLEKSVLTAIIYYHFCGISNNL